MKKIVGLLTLTLTVLSTFSQTTNPIWSEVKQNGDTVVVMTVEKAREIANTLIDFKECQYDNDLLKQRSVYSDSLTLSLKDDIRLSNESNQLADSLIINLNTQIENQVEVNRLLKQEIKIRSKKNIVRIVAAIGIGIFIGSFIK